MDVGTGSTAARQRQPAAHHIHVVDHHLIRVDGAKAVDSGRNGVGIGVAVRPVCRQRCAIPIVGHWVVDVNGCTRAALDGEQIWSESRMGTIYTYLI